MQAYEADVGETLRDILSSFNLEACAKGSLGIANGIHIPVTSLCLKCGVDYQVSL